VPRRIFITVSPIYERAVKRAIGCLEQDGFEVHYLGRPDESLEAGELLGLLRETEIYIVGNAKVPRSVIEGSPDLRLIVKYGAGVDNIDLDAAGERGVQVTNAPGANAVSVAEMTMGLMLSLARGLKQAEATLRAGEWRLTVGEELAGRTLGIIGLGNIGKEVAMRARAFGMRVLANDIVEYAEFCRRFDVRPAGLEQLLAEADVVSLHVPLTPLTRCLIGASQLARMKHGAVLIDTARGGVLDEMAVSASLQAGRLAGAAVDVFEREPLGPSPLRSLDNVILTPHIAGITRQAAERIADRTLENVRAYASGRTPPGLVRAASNSGPQ